VDPPLHVVTLRQPTSWVIAALLLREIVLAAPADIVAAAGSSSLLEVAPCNGAGAFSCDVLVERLQR
jgi:hypothetical protein